MKKAVRKIRKTGEGKVGLYKKTEKTEKKKNEKRKYQ